MANKNFPALKQGALDLFTIYQQVLIYSMQIESRFLEYASLVSKGDVNFVIVQKDNHNLFSFLEAATQGSCFCYVTGASGTGKSLASLHHLG